MTRRRAAGWGAVAGVAWASTFMVTSTALLRAVHAKWPYSGGPFNMFPLLGFFAPSASDPARWLYFWPAAALAGALVGLGGRQLRVRPWVRVVTLWIAFFPSVAVGTAIVMWLVAIANNLRGHSFFPLWRDVFALPGTLLVFAYGTVLISPVLAWPLLAAATTIEAWTRPSTARPARLGSAVARVALLVVLAVVLGGGLVYLRVSWEVIPGSCWWAPSRGDRGP